VQVARGSETSFSDSVAVLLGFELFGEALEIEHLTHVGL